MKKLLIMLFCVESLFANEITNVWLPAEGGNWSETDNWESGRLPNNSSIMVMTNLASGSAICMDQSVSFAGLRAGSTNDTDVWTLSSANNSFISTGSSSIDGLFDMLVENGTLHFQGISSQSCIGIVKRGAGTVQLEWNGFAFGSSPFRLDEGTLVLASPLALPFSTVTLNHSNAILCLASDSTLGAIESAVFPPHPIQLGQSRLSLGGKGIYSVFSGDVTGSGGLTAVNGGNQVLAGNLSYTGVTQLKDGDFTLWSDCCCAFYRFNDSGNAGVDSSANGNTLGTVKGTPTIVEDSDRGYVAHFDGTSSFKGMGENNKLNGLPKGCEAFTVAFWIKPASDCPANASIFGWGHFDIPNSQCIGMRFAKGFSSEGESNDALYTNWGNNRFFGGSTTIFDGGWHHFAFTYTGIENEKKVTVYLDGNKAFSFSQDLNLQPQGFTIGVSWNSTPFKGWIDDFYVGGAALPCFMIQKLMNNTFEIQKKTVLPPDASVESLMNGKLFLSGEQTLSTLAGAGQRGGVKLQNGDLTVTGTTVPTSTVFHASISGNGGFVKEGGEYNLTLTGSSSYTGATTVANGVLTLRSPISRDGLQVWYSFDDPADPGFDSSANGMDLFSIGNADKLLRISSSGKEGGSAVFSSSDAIRLNSRGRSYPAGFPTQNDPYTVSFWVKPSASAATANAPFFLWGKTDTKAMVFCRLNGNNQIMFSNFGNNMNFNMPDLTDGQWHHLVLTYDQSTIRVYCDGNEKGRQSVNSLAVNLSENALCIGRSTLNNVNYDGEMDEFQVYNRVWSAEEVTAEYNLSRPIQNGRAEDVLPVPVAHYTFSDPSNPGKDSGPYAYDMVPVGTVSISEVKSIPCLSTALSLQDEISYLARNQNDTFPEHLPTGNSPCTISCWVCLDSGASKDSCAVFWGNTASSMHLLGMIQETGRNFRYTFSSDNGTVVAKKIFPCAGYDRLRWHHLASVYNPRGSCSIGQASLYVDGVLQEGLDELLIGKVPTIDVPAENFFIGRKLSSFTAFKGLIADVRIYDKPLAAGQIRTLMRNGQNGATDSVLPESTTLSIAQGATTCLDGVNQTIAGLQGEGTLALRKGARLTVTGESNFAGPLTGQGIVAANGSHVTLSGDPSEFTGELVVSNGQLTVTGTLANKAAIVLQTDGHVENAQGAPVNAAVRLDDGIVLTLDPKTATFPLICANGPVTVGRTGKVQLNCAENEITTGSFVLAQGTSLTAANLSEWSVLPESHTIHTRLALKGNNLVLRIFRSGTILLVR